VPKITRSVIILTVRHIILAVIGINPECLRIILAGVCVILAFWCIILDWIVIIFTWLSVISARSLACLIWWAEILGGFAIDGLGVGPEAAGGG